MGIFALRRCYTRDVTSLAGHTDGSVAMLVHRRPLGSWDEGPPATHLTPMTRVPRNHQIMILRVYYKTPHVRWCAWAIYDILSAVSMWVSYLFVIWPVRIKYLLNIIFIKSIMENGSIALCTYVFCCVLLSMCGSWKHIRIKYGWLAVYKSCHVELYSGLLRG